MKKILSILAIMAILTLTVSATSVPNYDGRIWAVRGPVKGSADYASWAANTVQHIYDHGTPPEGESLAFDARLKLEDITQFTGVSPTTNRVIWFVVQVKARSTANRFRASSLMFTGTSTDSQHYLTNSTTLDGANIVFGAPFWGITYNGAARASDTVRTTAGGAYVKDVDLDETIFIGEQWPFFQYANETQWNSISNYVMGVTNFSIAGNWVLRGEGTNVLTRIGKTLGMSASPMMPQVSLMVSNQTTAILTANTGPYSSGILYSRSAMSGGWTTQGLVYGGQPQNYTFDPAESGYFKVVPQ